MTTSLIALCRLAFAAVLLASPSTPVHAAATIVLVNGNGPGEGFDDPTPVAPVGGNPGTTLGQQRINAFLYVANLWGTQITSAVPIRILSTFEPLDCTANSAVLGRAGPIEVRSDFPNAPVLATWYNVALANKLAGRDLSTDDDIRARFNSKLGNQDCLDGSPFYLGLDGNHGSMVDLVEVLLHEFAHGLGFSTVTDGSTGKYLDEHPSIYDAFAFDNTKGRLWTQMTDAERAASAINPRQLVWMGRKVTAAAPSVLIPGTPQLQVLAPVSVAGIYLVGTASFGPKLSFPGLTRPAFPIFEEDDTLSTACVPLDAGNSVNQRIAVVLRGTCTFVVKALNVQNAGAVGMIVIDNVQSAPPDELGGTDPNIKIPAIRITRDDGAKLLGAMTSNPSAQLLVRMGTDRSQLAGADKAGRVMLYTPNPFQSGSSVSHWDTSAFRNLLMEPAINDDLTQSVRPPEDLTLPMLTDLGW